jgi:4-hydroxybenzoate polyprenyltransferase
VTPRDLIAVHRLDFPLPLNYVCQSSWGACFALVGAKDVRLADVVAAIVANLLLIVSGMALNTVVDVRTDELQAGKRRLVGAIRLLGHVRLLWTATAEAGAALALAAMTGRPGVVVAAATTIGLQVCYNIEPVRLKKRGLSGTLAFGGAMTTLPCVLSCLAVRPDIPVPLWSVFLGVGIMASGRTVLWSAPDRQADTATGLATPSVRYGARQAVLLSCVVVAGGMILLGWGLWWWLGPPWVLPGLAAHAVFLVVVLVLGAGRTADVAALFRRLLLTVLVGDVLLVIMPLAVAW